MGVRPDPAAGRLAHTAADQIYTRRERHRDANPDRTDLARRLERWPGTDTLPDLLAVVDWVRHETDRTPAGILADDALDQLAILRHLAIEVRRRQHYAIQLARRSGVSWTEIAKALDVRTAQAAEQTAHRLSQAFEGDGTHDVPAARARRRTAAAPPPPPVAYPGLRDALAGMLKHRRELPERLDAELGYWRQETTARAMFSDEQLARGLRQWLLGDLVAAGVPLSPAAADAADRLANILGPPD